MLRRPHRPATRAVRRALAKLSEEAYQAQTELVVGGEAAAYEPLQLRVFALQARNAVTVAENQHLASWRQLAAALGLPDMPPGMLRGSADAALPEVSYEAALDYLLGHHTDLIIAQTQIDKAAYNLKLQRVTPIPDVDVYTAVQYDDTTSLNNTTYNLQVSVPLPLLNRNRGNIIAGEAEVVRARQELEHDPQHADRHAGRHLQPLSQQPQDRRHLPHRDSPRPGARSIAGSTTAIGKVATASICASGDRATATQPGHQRIPGSADRPVASLRRSRRSAAG